MTDRTWNDDAQMKVILQTRLENAESSKARVGKQEALVPLTYKGAEHKLAGNYRLPAGTTVAILHPAVQSMADGVDADTLAKLNALSEVRDAQQASSVNTPIAMLTETSPAAVRSRGSSYDSQDAHSSVPLFDTPTDRASWREAEVLELQRELAVQKHAAQLKQHRDEIEQVRAELARTTAAQALAAQTRKPAGCITELDLQKEVVNGSLSQRFTDQ